MKAGFCQECWAAWKGGGCCPWEDGMGRAAAEGSQCHEHLENILRAVRSGWCCALCPLPSQALSQPQIITDFSFWSQRQGQTFCLEAGLRLEPEVHLDQFPWELGSQREWPGAALLCCVLCGKSRFGFIMFLFLPCSPFLYAARNPPCLLAAAQEASGMFIRFFSLFSFHVAAGACC